MSRVALLGGSPAYRRGLRDGLADHGWTVDLIDDASQVQPPHSLLLVRMPDMERAWLPDTGLDGCAVVALAPEPIAEDHVTLIRAGATAVADTDDDLDQLASLLDALRAGHTILPLVTMHRLTAIARSQDEQPALADTEVSWLRDLGDGASVRQIATTHGWSDRAMHRALSALYRRLNVTNRAQAVAWAARHDLLDA